MGYRDIVKHTLAQLMQDTWATDGTRVAPTKNPQIKLEIDIGVELFLIQSIFVFAI